jgi:purine nucleoside permease
MYAINANLVTWAVHLTEQVKLADSENLQRSRARFPGFPNALKPPFVTRGATLSAGTFWHGSKLDEWANAWVRYYTGGKGNYMVAAMEDSGTLQALTFLSQAGRVDLQRVMVLRTVSNYDREPPGTSAADSLQEMVSGNYSAYLPSLEAAQIVGDKVVRDIVEHWAERETTIPNGK